MDMDPSAVNAACAVIKRKLDENATKLQVLLQKCVPHSAAYRTIDGKLAELATIRADLEEADALIRVLSSGAAHTAEEAARFAFLVRVLIENQNAFSGAGAIVLS